MTMVPVNESDAIANLDVDTHIERVNTNAVAVLNRSDVEAQLDAAHRYPRSIQSFLKEASTLAIITQEVAESCIYTLPRADKPITGPSVRLAEICASAYRNLHVGARVLDVEEKEVVAQGIAWDLEKNIRVTIEARRRITGKNGRRYNDDMINVTGAAAASIALRNAILRVIPRSYVNVIYNRAREVAVGNAKTLVTRRAEVVTKLQKMGVPVDRVFARVNRKGIDDITLEDLEVLIGLGTAVHSREQSIDDAFPAVDATPAKTKSLEADLLGQAPPKASPVKHDADGVVVEGPAQAEPAKAAKKPAKSEKPQPAATPVAEATPANDDGRNDEAAEAHFRAQEQKREREPGEEG